MSKTIRINTINLLSFFLINILLFLFIQSIVTSDTENEISPPTNIESDKDENNLTVTIEQSKIETDGSLPSESILSEKLTDLPTSIEVPSTINDERLSLNQDQAINSNGTSIDEEETLAITTTPLIKKTPPTINSFEEWKRQQLQSDSAKNKDGINNEGNEPSVSDTIPVVSLKNNVLSSNGSPLASNGNNNSLKKQKPRKNFASSSCGGKVLAHNPEAQNTNSILSSSPDEYMLNPCNAKIWFVIELCESIRISHIEIANFELFSSVPKTVRVFASDRFMTKEWSRHILGTFNVSYNRVIQSFQPTESSKFSKYVKFELVDFHGREHFCPLSVVRIFGSNVEDEMITMEEKTNGLESRSSSSQPEELDVDDEPSNSGQEQQNVGIGSAIIGIARQVFRIQTSRDAPSTTNSPTIETNSLKSDCAASKFQIPLDEFRLKSWRQTNSFKRCVARFVQARWQKLDICTNYFSQTCFLSIFCCQCPFKSMTIIPRKSTTNIYRIPCAYYHLLTNRLVCKQEKIHRFNETISSKNNSTNESNNEIREKNRNLDEQNFLKSNDSSTVDSPNNDVFLDQNSTILDETNSTMNNISSAENNNFNLSNNTTSNSTVEINKNETNSTESLTIDSTNSNNDFLSSMNNALNQADNFPPGLYSQWLKGILINTKSLPELFKIIEKLNFNLTLSNRYLQELSEHYLKKLDETQQTTDLLREASKDADLKFKRYEEQLWRLQRNFDEISFRLMKLEVWIPLIVLALIVSIFIVIWSSCHLISSRREIEFLRKSEQRKRRKSTDDEHEEDEDQRVRHKMTNGFSKRKLSTDSTDSNFSRSQRVPDLSLPKIRENGHHKALTNKRKFSHETDHLVGLSAAQT